MFDHHTSHLSLLLQTSQSIPGGSHWTIGVKQYREPCQPERGGGSRVVHQIKHLPTTLSEDSTATRKHLIYTSQRPLHVIKTSSEFSMVFSMLYQALLVLSNQNDIHCPFSPEPIDVSLLKEQTECRV